jgi:hypothetical protein
MAKKKEVDGKRLVKMVKEGAAQSEIMKKFGFNTSTQLKLAYANALMEAGEIPESKVRAVQSHQVGLKRK